MDEQPLFRGRGAVVVMLAVAVLVMIAFLGGTDQQEPSNRRSSTYSAGPAGTKAFAELLRTTGFEVAQVRVPVAETAPDPRATVVVIDARLDRADEEALKSFVSAGGRLVLAGSRFSDVSEPVLGLIPSGSSGQFRAVFPELPGARLADLPVPVDAYAVGTELLPLMASTVGVLVGSKAVGAGRVLMLGDARLLENQYLGRADNAAVAVGLVGDTSRPVLVLEYPHGFDRAEGLAAIPIRWRCAFALIALAGALWMWGRGRQLGPPDREHRELAPPRVEFVNSMAAGLARTGDLGGALAPLQRRLEHEVDAGAPHGTQGDSAAVESLAARVGLDAAEVRRGLLRSSDPETAMAVGRVMAALSQSRIRRGG